MTIASSLPVAVITLCSSHRLDHLRHQEQALKHRDPQVVRIVVWLDSGPLPVLPETLIVQVPPGPDGFRLAAARNAGAQAAIGHGAGLLIFLDADCVPGPALVRRYLESGAQFPGSVLCGPVTYLPEHFAMSIDADLAAATNPHPGRPMPAPGESRTAAAAEYALFWSLSFALTPETWQRAGGFDERYQGYGAEDTDFARQLRTSHVPIQWIGGADAYHQYHPTSDPPWQNVTDIVRNANLFFQKWQEWPMLGWLRAFEQSGAVVLENDRYRIPR